MLHEADFHEKCLNFTLGTIVDQFSLPRSGGQLATTSDVCAPPATCIADLPDGRRGQISVNPRPKK
jgi:hypothetical protein